MRLTRLLVAAALVAAVAGGAMAKTAEKETPLAVLMSCSGAVTVLRAGGEQIDGTFGLPLQAGDEVKTGAGASAEILFEAGNWLQVGAGSSIAIKPPRGAMPAAGEGGEAESFEVVQNFLKLKHAEGTSTLTGLRSGEKDQELVALSPSQTKVRDGHPTFRWEIADPSTELRLTVYGEDGVHWQQDVSGATSVEYPEDAPELDPGVNYSWTLETTDPLAFPPMRTAATFFEIAGGDVVEHLDQKLSGLGREEMSDYAQRVLRASIYFNHGMIDDAIAETELALENDPNNKSLQSILARLYEQAGRTRDAISTYRKLETK
jgi:hypothetical protein